MAFLWYLLSLLFGLDAQAVPQAEKQALKQQVATTSETTPNIAERKKGGGGGDRSGGHGPIIVVEDTHFKMGD